MVKETVHIVQPYWEDKRKGLVPAEALPVRSVDAAHERAKCLFDTGNYAGVDAFTITADEELGKYGRRNVFVPGTSSAPPSVLTPSGALGIFGFRRSHLFWR